MSVKRLAALLAAVIMAVAALSVRSAKAYGETCTITLVWPHKWVLVSVDENPHHHGYFDVEYDEDGYPFYRVGDDIFYVDPESVEEVLEFLYTVQVTVDDESCLTGREFEAKDLRYFQYEVTEWSTAPGGRVAIRSNQPFWQVRELLCEGMTLYPVTWQQLPHITYHNTYSGESFISRGGHTETVAGECYERPYGYQAGWAEEPGEEVQYNSGDEIPMTENIDLYSVWKQSRISGIPPVNRFSLRRIEHLWFGGRRWRKIGEDWDKVLLIYDNPMTKDGDFYEYDNTAYLYRYVEASCTDWYNGFSGAEQAAVCSTDKGMDSLYFIDGDRGDRYPPLQGAKLFLFSAPEAYTYFSGDDDRKLAGAATNQWFLRNGEEHLGHADETWGIAAIVDADGKCSFVPCPTPIASYAEQGLYLAAGERPAFVLDRTPVLFTSSAAFGYKSSAPEDGSSFGRFSGSDDPYEGDLWREEQKATLLDENFQGFTAQGNDPNSAAVTPEGTVEISFANAVIDSETEQNRYVSAMLCDSGDEVLGYASMKPEASSGTWVLTLPPGLDVSAGDYILKVFNEQQNSGWSSDFASPFSIIHLTKATVPEFGTPDLTMPAELRAIEANAFEGVEEIKAVDARNCTYIGEEAFKNCTELTQIMVDAECEIEEGAFSTDGTVWVYANGEGKAKTFCDTHEGFEFVQVE